MIPLGRADLSEDLAGAGSALLDPQARDQLAEMDGAHEAGPTCALNLHEPKCILCIHWHWFSVKVSVRTVAHPSCPRTCLTRPVYDAQRAKPSELPTKPTRQWGARCVRPEKGQKRNESSSLLRAARRADRGRSEAHGWSRGGRFAGSALFRMRDGQAHLHPWAKERGATGDYRA